MLHDLGTPQRKTICKVFLRFEFLIQRIYGCLDLKEEFCCILKQLISFSVSLFESQRKELKENLDGDKELSS